MNRLIPLFASMTLAACSQGEPGPAIAESTEPSETPSQAAARPTAAPTPALLIPDRFHGIWDYVKGSCDPASDMRTEIAERGITFYESHGAVTALTIDSPERITVELAMQGEGERWTMTRTFTLSQGDTTLTPTGGGDTGEPMPLKRCA
jgi:hypothetical protein